MKFTILLLLLGLGAVYCISPSELVGNYEGVWRVDDPANTLLRFTLNGDGTGSLSGASIGGTRAISWTYYNDDNIFFRIDRSDLTEPMDLNPKFQYAVYKVYITGNGGIRLRGTYIHPNVGGISTETEVSKV
jgi:hypothetical protein